MSKYICKKCGLGAKHIDFYIENTPETVFVTCKPCNIQAWGGLRFHPAMNALLNKMFQPNFEYKQTDAENLINLDEYLE